MKREAKLTPHGEVLLHHAVRIHKEIDAAKCEATPTQSRRKSIPDEDFETI